MDSEYAVIEAMVDGALKARRVPIVCICGSTRFADQHAIVRWEIEKRGAIGLMINYLPDWYAKQQGLYGNDHLGERAGIKKELDALHLRKIDLADCVLVVNVDGYVGESTAAAIAYATRRGKVVWYLEERDLDREVNARIFAAEELLPDRSRR